MYNDMRHGIKIIHMKTSNLSVHHICIHDTYLK